MPLQPSGPDDQPLSAEAVEGEVVVCSPSHGRVCIALTPEAARASCQRIIDAAEEAVRQRDSSGPH